MMPGPRIGAAATEKSTMRTVDPWPPCDALGIVRPNLDRPARGHLGDGVDDLQIAWLIIGWLLAFWAGKDLQTRFVQWRSLRRGA